MTWPSIRLSSIWILGLSLMLEARSQTVELASSQLSILTGAERDGFLSAHNAARKEVAVDPVQWSDNLASHARDSLDQQKDALIAAAKEGWTQRKTALPRHSADRTYGENVAGWVASSASGTSAPATKPPAADWAVTLWLREKDDFDKLNAIAPYRVGDEKDQPNEKHRSEADPDETKPRIIVGHYTQIVWSATRQIGAAKLVFDLIDQGNHRTYTAILCNYNPPGNRQGQKPF